MHKTRTGLLGGSFDPIHNGHLAIAEEVYQHLKLDRVLFIPAAQQPLKTTGHRASPAARYEMAKLACAENDSFKVSSIELQRAGVSYTVDSLEILSQSREELFFIAGADALADLARWHAAQRIIELAQIVAVERPGFTLDTPALFRSLPSLASRLIAIPGPRLDISSTELRRRVAAGQPIRYQTPDAVVEFILRHRLYHEDLLVPPETQRPQSV